MKHKHIPLEDTPGDILVVDDMLESLRTIEALLKEQGYKVRCVPDGKTALAVAANQPPELMLLDVIMPGMSGYEVCRALKACPETAGFPIIFLTALTEMENLVEGFQAGGVDFLSKPVRPEELLAHVNTHLELYRARKAIQQHAELLEQRVAERTAELQEANRQLWESQLFSQTLLNSSPDIIYIYDIIEKKNVYSNEGIMKVLGYSVKEVQDMGVNLIPTLMHPEDLDIYQKEILPRYQKLKNGELIEHEYRMKHKDGMWRWLHSKESIFQRLSNGKPKQISGVVSDITERKRVEGALRKSEEEYRTMIESSHEIIFSKNCEGRYHSLNLNAAIGLGGTCIEDVAGKTDYDLLPREQAAALQKIDKEVMESGKTLEIEEVISNTQGQERIYLSRKWPTYDDEGRASGIGCFASDITERKLAEEALRKDEEVLEQIFATTNSMIAYMDRDFNFIRVNRAYADAGGQEPEDFIGENHFVLYPHEENEAIFRHVVETGEPYVVAAKPFKHPDQPERGTTYWDWTLLPVKEEQGDVTGLLLSLADVTEQKQAELVLQQANVELENKVDERTRELIEANKLLQHAKDAAEEAQQAAEVANRAKSEFLTNMSHDLRTPMNAILGFAQLMERDPALTATQQEYLGIIRRGGEHLLILINDVLDMSRIEAGRVTLNIQSFDVWHMLINIEEMIRMRAEKKGLLFTVSRAPDVPRYIQTDESKLRQVLVNLLGNAVKFTKEGSVKLRIANCELRKEPTPYPSQVGKSEIRNLKFEISDTGIGIAPEEIESIFETFGRTQRSEQTTEGTGLGLAISRKFVQLMGGNITAESEIGKGSLFKFEIQAEAAEMVEGSTEQPIRRVIGLEPNQAKYRILIAEDKAESRLFLSKLLQSVGFEVREAVNGQEALEASEQWQPHLILMDMRMPVMDGYTATREIRNSKFEIRNVPIIALTASAFEEERKQILAIGCNDFIRKPFKENRIFDTLAKYLGVRYVYEEGERINVKGEGVKVEEVLTPEVLAALPPDLLTDLERATRRSDMNQILDLLTELRTHNAAVADALVRLADEFRYEAMLAFFQKHREETP